MTFMTEKMEQSKLDPYIWKTQLLFLRNRSFIIFHKLNMYCKLPDKKLSQLMRVITVGLDWQCY